tara:strand:+ start:1436 stop:2749 length:1314 start_codon:yes stop_codon:yes gene_type:complete
MDALIMAAQMILALSIIVGIHEFGHLLTAKMFGMRVEQYFIGFPPRIWSFIYKGTEYGFGSIPLGGFVKISGIIDESMDTSHINKDPEPWEFRSKPPWQRLVVMLGGIIFNVITGLIIFTMITFNNGETYLSKDEINKNGVLALELGMEAGFETGDKILLINGSDWERDAQLFDPNLFFEDNTTFTVLRENQEVNINIPDNFINRMNSREAMSSFLKARTPFLIDSVYSNAQKADLMKGDKIIKVDEKFIIDLYELRNILEKNKSSIAQITIDRNGDLIDKVVEITKEGTIGIKALQKPLIFSKKDYNLSQSFIIGSQKAFGVVFLNIKAFGKMFSGDIDPSKNLSGPIGIAQIFGNEWDWGNFWRIIGLLSMVLAFMNLLPIPALDGGHATFILYEMISGKKPTEKFLEYSTKFGVIILLGLMSYVILNDIYKLFI